MKTRPRTLLLLLLCMTYTVISAQLSMPRASSTYWRDSVPQAMQQSYIAYGAQYAGQPWPTIPDSIFGEFKHTGNRTHYERLCFQKRTRLAALALAEIIEGKGRFIPDLKRGLENLFSELWWGIPAHYGHDRPLSTDQNVDLFNAETAGLAAWINYMLGEALGSDLRQTIDKEVRRRLLIPALKTDYWWKHSRMNWTPWICSNWLTAVLISENDGARKAEALRQITAALQYFADGYPSDGGCDEGTFYWDRAAASLFDCLQLMQAANLTVPTSLPKEKIKAMAAYIYKMYIGNGYCVNFADAHDNRSVVQLNVLYPFALWADDETMRRYAAWIAKEKDFFHRPSTLFAASGNFPTLGRELFLLSNLHQLQAEKPAEPLLENVWLPDLQIMTARNNNKKHGFYVAMKGGTNAESHNHNDVGSFIVYADAQPLLIDVGVGEYTSATFSADRYKLWTMQSAYHNLPKINGIDQHEGEIYRATCVKYHPKSLAMDIAPAYPASAQVMSWQRKVELKAGETVVVTEDYRLSEWKEPQRIMLMTPILPTIARSGVLQLGKYRLLYPSQQVVITIEDVSERMDSLLKSVWGPHLYRIVMTVNNKKTRNKIIYNLQ